MLSITQTVHQMETNAYLYECPTHPATSFENLNAFRTSETLCDVTIKVGDSLFHAHKVVLSSTSPYFHAMFTSGLREGNTDFVELHDMDAESVSLLLEFMYTSKVKIVEGNVQCLLPASNILQLNNVRDACCRFLQEQLDPCNALGILLFADTHGCKELADAAEMFVLHNFVNVAKTEEFLTLNVKKMKLLLDNDYLTVQEESFVYTALIRWIKHDLDKRQEHIPQLLASVRLPLMPRDFLMLTVESEELIRSNSQCKDLLIEAMKYHLMPEMRRYLQTNRTKPRLREKTLSMIYVLGGQSLFAIHCESEMFSPVKEVWSAVPPMSVRRARLGVVVINDKVYAVGGFDGSQDLSSTEILDVRSKTWSSGLNMGTSRSCLGVVVLHGLIYAIGGYDGSSCLNSVERYDPLSNQWMSVAKMNSRRRYVSVGVIDEHIIAAGGYDGNCHLDSCEVYDPVLNSWSMKSPMKTQRSSAGGCVLNGNFYVSGGTDGSIIVISVERYDMHNDTWTYVRNMLNVRMTHALIAVDNTLLAIGGNDGTTSLNSVEQYKPEADTWSYITPMGTRRSHVSATAMMLDKDMDLESG